MVRTPLITAILLNAFMTCSLMSMEPSENHKNEPSQQDNEIYQPDENVLKFLQELSDEDLLSASLVNKQYNRISYGIIRERLRSYGFSEQYIENSPNIFSIFKQCMTSPFMAEILPDEEGHRHGYFLRVTKSSDNNIPVGTILYLHPDRIKTEKNLSGRLIFFTKVSNRPIHSPRPNDTPKKLALGTYGFSDK